MQISRIEKTYHASNFTAFLEKLSRHRGDVLKAASVALKPLLARLVGTAGGGTWGFECYDEISTLGDGNIDTVLVDLCQQREA